MRFIAIKGTLGHYRKPFKFSKDCWITNILDPDINDSEINY